MKSWDTYAKTCALSMLQAHGLFFMVWDFMSPVPKDSSLGTDWYFLVRLRLTTQ